MPNWEGIEDSSPQASRIWLTRKDEKDDWTPLRKCDCQALNIAKEVEKDDTKPVHIDGGRCTADPVAGIVFNNFFRGHKRELCSTVWFLKEEKSSKEFRLVPIRHEPDSDIIEDLYQSAVTASSSFGKGIKSILNEERSLQEEGANAKVKVYQSGSTVTMRRIPDGWFAGSQELQRGYGAYEVEGEEDEMSLGSVKHLVFVVHGIGEAMFSRENVKIPSMVDQMNTTRIDIQRKQVKLWRELCEKAAKEGGKGPPPPSRIEFIPIEWFNQLHDSSSALMQSLKASTIPSIPALRAIANDVVFDVLMYMTPEFCESVLECVTQQVSDLHKAFLKVHPGFKDAGGKVSFIGHSLGSVIVWDLLSLLKDTTASPSQRGLVVANQETGETGHHAYAKEADANKASNGTWGPSLPKPLGKTIPFVPDVTVFLGSPLGMFLTLRGAHAVFDELRMNAENNQVSFTVDDSKNRSNSDGDGSGNSKDPVIPPTSPFALPTGRLYNIFNPSDPVAYRIEPLLLPQGWSPLPEPAYLQPPGKDLRLHLKARKLTNDLKKTILESKSSWNMLIGTAVTAVAALAPEDDKKDEMLPNGEDNADTSRSTGSRQGPPKLRFALAGEKNDRVDLSFQPAVIDNEYLSAVMAHSTGTYFGHEDLQEFLLSVFGAPEV